MKEKIGRALTCVKFVNEWPEMQDHEGGEVWVEAASVAVAAAA